MSHKSGAIRAAGSSENPSWSFDSGGIGLQAQKKFLSSISGRKLARRVVDDVTGQVLNDLYRLLRQHYDKKTAEQRVRGIIKVIVKLSLLASTNQFDAVELETAGRFRERFRVLVMTVVSFSRVDFTFDRGYLLGLFRECERLLLQLKVRHLSDKSQARIEDFFRCVGSPDLLDAVFVEKRYAPTFESMVNGLDTLVEKDRI